MQIFEFVWHFSLPQLEHSLGDRKISFTFFKHLTSSSFVAISSLTYATSLTCVLDRKLIDFHINYFIIMIIISLPSDGENVIAPTKERDFFFFEIISVAGEQQRIIFIHKVVCSLSVSWGYLHID